jgi:hypothetical protein
MLNHGNLYGVVTEDRGAPLPGVTISLTASDGMLQLQVTNARGEFRFLELAPGTYTANVEMEDFTSVEFPDIVIATGRNLEIFIKMTSVEQA